MTYIWIPLELQQRIRYFHSTSGQSFLCTQSRDTFDYSETLIQVKMLFFNIIFLLTFIYHTNTIHSHRRCSRQRTAAPRLLLYPWRVYGAYNPTCGSRWRPTADGKGHKGKALQHSSRSEAHDDETLPFHPFCRQLKFIVYYWSQIVIKSCAPHKIVFQIFVFGIIPLKTIFQPNFMETTSFLCDTPKKFKRYKYCCLTLKSVHWFIWNWKFEEKLQRTWAYPKKQNSQSSSSFSTNKSKDIYQLNYHQ